MPKPRTSKPRVSGRSNLDVEFLVHGGPRVPRAFVARATAAILAELKKPGRLARKSRTTLAAADSLQLVFVTKPMMAKLNREFRGKSYATDVLSFAPTEPGSLGELVFSLDVLKQQAKAHDMKFQDELGYMVLHGVLHLLGYDHEESEAGARRMFRLQDKVFDAVRRRW